MSDFCVDYIFLDGLCLKSWVIFEDIFAAVIYGKNYAVLVCSGDEVSARLLDVEQIAR